MGNWFAAPSKYNASDVRDDYNNYMTAMILESHVWANPLKQARKDYHSKEAADRAFERELKRLLGYYLQVQSATVVDYDGYEEPDLPDDVEVWDVQIRVVDMTYSQRTVYWKNMFDGEFDYKRLLNLLQKVTRGKFDPVGCSNIQTPGAPPGSYHCDECLMEVAGKRPNRPNPFDACEEQIFNSLRDPAKYALKRFVNAYPENTIFSEIAKAIQKSGIMDIPYKEIMHLDSRLKDIRIGMRNKEKKIEAKVLPEEDIASEDENLGKKVVTTKKTWNNPDKAPIIKVKERFAYCIKKQHIEVPCSKEEISELKNRIRNHNSRLVPAKKKRHYMGKGVYDVMSDRRGLVGKTAI